jgi:hypothetical protein
MPTIGLQGMSFTYADFEALGDFASNCRFTIVIDNIEPMTCGRIVIDDLQRKRGYAEFYETVDLKTLKIFRETILQKCKDAVRLKIKIFEANGNDIPPLLDGMVKMRISTTLDGGVARSEPFRWFLYFEDPDTIDA